MAIRFSTIPGYRGHDRGFVGGPNHRSVVLNLFGWRIAFRVVWGV